MFLRTRVMAATAIGLAMAAATGTAAAPANPNAMVLDLSCSNGQRYSVSVIRPAGERAAVRVLESTSVLVPTAFQWHTVMTDDEGAVLDESTTPMYPVHGQSDPWLDTMTCTFLQVAHHVLPEGGVLTIQVEGTVRAHLTP